MNAKDCPADDVSVVPVRTRAQLRSFIQVPFDVYGHDPHWVAPLLLERRQSLSPRATPYLRRAETAFWIATQKGRAVGRISAQLDPAVQARDPGLGHFGLLAAENRPEVFDALFTAAEMWLRAHGAHRAQGPFDLSINEESGLLVDGFDTPPMLLMPHNPAYVPGRVEEQGYAKAMDLLAYLLECGRDWPPNLAAFLDRPPPPGVTVRPLRWRDYDVEIRTLVGIFNDAWQGNWGFIPFGEDDVDLMARHLRPLIDERLVWFAELNGEAVAFAVCLPNLNEALAEMKGRLWPAGWLKLLWRLKVSGFKTGRVPLMGVRRSLGGKLVAGLLPFLLIGALRDEVKARGFERMELSWILETNPAMRSIAEALCGPAYKTYRVYEKTLA